MGDDNTTFDLDKVGEFEGCCYLDQADVKLLVTPGVVGVDEHLGDQPHLFMEVRQVDVVLPSHHVKLEDREAIQAVRGCQHPVLVDDAASTEMRNTTKKVAERNLLETNIHECL